MEAVQVMSCQCEIEAFPSPIDLGVRSPFQKRIVVTRTVTKLTAQFLFGFAGKLGELKRIQIGRLR